MTDQELLEYAAKAANYEVEFDNRGAYIHEGSGPQSWSNWNPLGDDGDALRLAVKLRLCYGPNMDGDLAVVFGDHVRSLTEPYEPDCYAATRRAIVRAAAEIGRSMEDD